MSEEPEKDQGQAAGESEDLTAMMDEVLEKLRLLNYDKEFLTNKGVKALNKGYFVNATNQIEQFNYFKQLVKWLFTVNESQAQDISKYDEPLTVAQNIQMELKKLGIEADFPPLKLKSGAGEEVLVILLALVNRALKVKRFQFKPPKMGEVAGQTDQAPNMEGDDTTHMELGGADDEEIEEEGIMDDEQPGQKQDQDEQQDKNVLKSKVEEKEWILECERVAPKLKYQVAGETKEWRGHIETLKNFSDGTKKNFPDTRARLEKISDDLSKTLERIAQRENSINVNLNELGTEYRSQMDDLKKLQQLYQNKNEIVNDLKDKFKKADDALSALQGKIDEHGSHATDSSPLVKIKEAIKNMRVEIAAIELRSGIVSHRVLAHMSKEKKEKVTNPKQKKGALHHHAAEQLDDLDD